MLQLLLNPRDFRVRTVELSLRCMQGIARGIVCGAPLFQAIFHVAQLRDLRFQFYAEPLHILLIALTLRLRFGFAQQPELVLRRRELLLQVMILLRYTRLRVQILQLRFQLAPDIVHAQQIFARVVEAQTGFAPPLFIFGNARRFLEEHAQLFRLGLDDARDHALFDNGISAHA